MKISDVSIQPVKWWQNLPETHPAQKQSPKDKGGMMGDRAEIKGGNWEIKGLGMYPRQKGSLRATRGDKSLAKILDQYGTKLTYFAKLASVPMINPSTVRLSMLRRFYGELGLRAIDRQIKRRGIPKTLLMQEG